LKGIFYLSVSSPKHCLFIQSFVMDHSESGHQDRRPQLPQHYLQQQQQQEQQQQEQSLGGRPHQPPPPGAQQPRSWLSQQQQQQQQQLYLQRDQHQEHHQGGNSGGRRPYNPQQAQPGDNTMNIAAAAPLTHHQNEYNISASMVAAAQQQQYLQQQQQQQQQYEAAVATAGGNPGLVSVTQQQQQYAQQISYQQQLAMQQMAATAPIQPRGGTHQHLHHGSTPQQPHHTLHHPMVVGPQQPQQHPSSRMDHSMLTAAVAAGLPHPHVQVHQSQHHLPQHLVQQPQVPYIQPRVGRLQADRPLIKLTVSLIDTYKCINTVYYQEREARRAARGSNTAVPSSSTVAPTQQQQQIQSHNQSQQQSLPDSNIASQSLPTRPHPQGKKKPSAGVSQQYGTNNNGWDDDNYDYIINSGELFYDGRYKLKERIGKGSFGQVVRAVDLSDDSEVAIKIIKSKKPFLMQAKTEIELLNHLNEKDTDDQHNIGEES
jgi:hypothetical protein